MIGVRRLFLTVLALAAACAFLPAVASATPGATLWTAQGSGPFAGGLATSVAVSPDGSRTYVSGFGFEFEDPDSAEDFYGFATVAYDSATGSELWTARYVPPNYASFGDGPIAVAASPDGSRVYVMGSSRSPQSAGVSDYTTIAYDAATGHQLWRRNYDGPAHGNDVAAALAVSPDGGHVYVTGISANGSGNDILTIAYDSATGARAWARRSGPAQAAAWIAASPDGARVYVAGTSAAGECVTIAYNSATGKRLWRATRPSCTTDVRDDSNRSWNAPSLVASPDGTRVYVAGTDNTTQARDDVTIAYDASTGRQVWARRYHGPANKFEQSGAISLSPNGETLYMTATSVDQDGCSAFISVAYDAATGARLWGRRYSGSPTCNNQPPGVEIDNRVTSIAVNPDGSEVYVTGASFDPGTNEGTIVTVAYDAASGHRLWLARDTRPGSPTALAVSPDGARLFVTGQTSRSGFTTLAYSTR